MKQRNARFWFWHRGGWVKLTLKPGDSIEHYHGHPTEEGSYREWNTFRYEDEQVTIYTCIRQSDCDGRHEDVSAVHCHVDQLRAINQYEHCEDCRQPENVGIFRPAWERGEHRVRDEFAEAMGY